MTAEEDPWRGLDPPTSATTANMRPTSSDTTWDFYWMVDYQRRRLLGLKHARGLVAKNQLPKLSGIQVETVQFSGDEELLVFRLLESAHREIFQRLCTDIISSTHDAKDEKGAVGAALARTWRWHYLLKGGADRRLSNEEQKGLIGEIRVLEEHLFPACTVADALEMWTGPSGAPKDFELGSTAIEAKARRGGSQPKIAISSEDQLDPADFTQVFLHVIHLSRPGPADDGFTITEVVARIREYVTTRDLPASQLLEVHLAAAGYRDEDDYSDSLWMETGASLYQVTGDFPRIAASELRSGVKRVRYEISMIDCEPYVVTDEFLTDAIGGALRER
jgi:hypothetical protein